MTDEIPLDASLCPQCKKNKASTRKSKLCAKCHNAWLKSQEAAAVPEGLAARVRLAKTAEDWQRLAADIAPTMEAILNGEKAATAAQASLIKTILDRAYGKPTASQQEQRQAAGVIILPTLDSGEKTMVCPKCGYEAKANLES